MIDWSNRFCSAHILRDCWVCYPELNPDFKKRKGAKKAAKKKAARQEKEGGEGNLPG